MHEILEAVGIFDSFTAQPDTPLNGFFGIDYGCTWEWLVGVDKSLPISVFHTIFCVENGMDGGWGLDAHIYIFWLLIFFIIAANKICRLIRCMYVK